MSGADRTIHVTGLSPQTTRESLQRFFSFCGQTEAIHHLPEKGTADVVFSKPGAAKTASFLSGGQLDGSAITVHWAGDDKDDTADHSHDGELRQEDKPRSAIAAEYLSHGYVLGDAAIAKSIELDNKYGISARFLNFFKPLSDAAVKTLHDVDAKTGVSARATEADKQYHASEKATQAATQVQSVGKSYYEKALHSPLGSRVATFYSQTTKQITDVHEEARRIADSRKAGSAPPTPVVPSAPTAGPSGTTATTAEQPAPVAPNVQQA